MDKGVVRRVARRHSSWVRHGLALAAAILFVLPLYWAIVASLGPTGAPPETVQWWPSGFHLENYVEIFQVVPMRRYLANSMFVVSYAVPITLGVASLAGFAMSQLPDGTRQRLVVFSIVLLLIPNAAVWMFRYQLIRWLGLLDTLWALILPAFAATNPLFVLLFYWAYRRIPQELYDAARLDAASALTIWWALATPLIRPTVVGVLVLSFVYYWSDFTGPVLYIFDTGAYTLPVGLQLINQFGSARYPLIMAAVVFITGPVLGLFLLLQRFFLTDLSLANLFEKN